MYESPKQPVAESSDVEKMPFFELALSAFHDRVSQSVFVSVLSEEKNKNKTESEEKLSVYASSFSDCESDLRVLDGNFKQIDTFIC